MSSEPNHQVRAIAALRLSHLTDATTSTTTQAESIEEYCQRNDIQIVATTSDLDVSGGKPIRERPGIGPYLAEDRLAEWDVLIVYKLDRGFRNHYDFVSFYHEYCQMRGKQIISVGEQIDMSTDMGKFYAGMLVQFAEWELKRMSERRSAAQSVIRREARYGGGSFPFGYAPYKDGNAYYLKPHPVYKAETVKMAEALVSGIPAGTIAKDMNARNVPTSTDVQRMLAGKDPKGIKWTTHSVVAHLRSDAIRGYVLHHTNGNKPIRVLDASNDYVMREPLITGELWYEVQAQLDKNTVVHSGVRSSGSAMLQIAFCDYCNAPLHQSRYNNPSGRTKREYYRCRDMGRGCYWHWLFKQSDLETFVSDTLLDAVGDCELQTTRIIPGDDHSEALKSLSRQIQDLTALQFTPGAVVPQNIEERISALKAEYLAIAALPKEDDRTEPVSTGRTFAGQWDEWNAEQRHSYLKSSSVKVYVSRNESGDTDQLPDFTQLDPDGRTVFGISPAWKIRVYLGSVADLRDKASKVTHS